MSDFVGLKRSSGGGAAAAHPFKHTVTFADENNDYPTTVTTSSDDFWFMGSLLLMRRIYKSLGNYESGFAIISTPKTPHPNQPEGAQHVCLIDLENFLRYFGNPLELASRLVTKAKELMVQWRSANTDLDAESRRPLFYFENVAEYKWFNAKKKAERSIWELQISSYQHVLHLNNSGGKTKIAFEDLKLIIKLATSVGVNQGPDRSGANGNGMRQDRHGANVSFLHFIALLRSAKFEKLVADSKRSYRVSLGYEEEVIEPPAKRLAPIFTPRVPEEEKEQPPQEDQRG
jgi:hypothetical protein